MFGARMNDKAYMKSGLQSPYLVIEDALEPAFAERLRTELLSSKAWVSGDRSSFSDEYQKIMPSDYSFTRDTIRTDSPFAPQSVKELHSYLTSAGCLQWISEVSGRLCNGFVAACVRYQRGNHLTRHNDLYFESKQDGAVTARTVTFNYYLTKGWQSEWGGRFVWEKPHIEITPSFNTLVMFLVGFDSLHYVEQVNETATVPRLAVTGWFMTTRKPGYRILNIASS